MGVDHVGDGGGMDAQAVAGLLGWTDGLGEVHGGEIRCPIGDNNWREGAVWRGVGVGKERRCLRIRRSTDGHLQIIGQLAYHNLRSLVESFGVLLRSRGGYTADEVDALSESGSCHGPASGRNADGEVENTGRAFMIDIDENDIWQR
jgi:hypothetical protein